MQAFRSSSRLEGTGARGRSAPPAAVQRARAPSASVHQRSPDGYKKLAGKRNASPSNPTDDNEKKKEDEGDGQ
jgi:hypothetical protein